MSEMIKTRVAVACSDARGNSSFFITPNIEVDEVSYMDGLHCEKAAKMAGEAGYEVSRNSVCFDDTDHHAIINAARELAPEEFVSPDVSQFLRQVAGFYIWDHDDDEGENEDEPPSEGYLDSHLVLMRLIREARALLNGKSEAAAASVTNMAVSLDGGEFWQPAPQGVRVSWNGLSITDDPDDEAGELLLNCTHEGIITDVIESGLWREDHQDEVIATDCFLVDDIVARLLDTKETELLDETEPVNPVSEFQTGTYRVVVTRTAHRALSIEVEAGSIEDAEAKALHQALESNFPGEYASDYEAKATLIS